MSAGPGGTRCTWLTCALDGVDHAITDEAFACAGARADGRYVALCNATVWASSLASPPAGRCVECESAAAGVPRPSARRRASTSTRSGGLISRVIPGRSA